MDQMAVQNGKYSRPKNLAQMSSWVLMRPLNQRKGSVGIEDGHKTTTAWTHVLFGSRRSRSGRTTRKPWWTMKNTQKPRNPNADLRSRKVRTYNHGSSAEVAAVLWTDSGWCSGQGRRRRRRSATTVRLEQQEGCERKKTERERRMRKAEACLFIRERCEQTGVKIEGEPNNGYPTTQTPRFSEDIKDEDPLGDDVIKVFCVFKRWRHGGLQKLLRG